MTTIAVMQPYFFPYAGYFRLFTAADTVVMFDCVQFPRRGWVHRNRFTTATGELDWLTLPLEKAPRDIRIEELRLAPDVHPRLRSAMQRFPVLANALQYDAPIIKRTLDIPDRNASAYLCRLVSDAATVLGIGKPIIRSSILGIDPALRAQDRVLAIVKALGGNRYVNPPGGRGLYSHAAFEDAGIQLRFLTPYGGDRASILSRLLVETPSDITKEIERETVLAA